MPAVDDDQQLVAAAQAGDGQALEELLRRHYDRVHAVCRRIVGSVSDADDAAQEAMIGIVRGLPRFGGGSGFSAWASRAATNTARDELRGRRRRPALTLGDARSAPADTVDPRAAPTVESSVERRVI